MIAGTVEAERAEERHELGGRALVDALALGQGVQGVEHLEEPSGWLVNRADYRAAAPGQGLQQRDALEAGRRVQAAAKQ